MSVTIELDEEDARHIQVALRLTEMRTSGCADCKRIRAAIEKALTEGATGEPGCCLG